MYAFRIGDLETVMNIPVPFRKWLIRRWNKQKEKENPEQSNVNKPLSVMERAKINKESMRVTNKDVGKPLASPLAQMKNLPK